MVGTKKTRQFTYNHFSMAKRQYIHQYQPAEDIETIRIPILGSAGNRGTSSSKDQRFVNGYFWEIKNPVTGKAVYQFVKRPGLSQNTRPPAGAATGRGLTVWKDNIYSVFDRKIYKGSTDLGITLTNAGTGICGFAATRPGAATQYLGVNDGTSLYLIATDDSVIILNNVTITSSSVANPTVITATAHGLATGNKIIIRDHSGSTPSINGTIYTVTVTGANTFTIPVNVTVGGTGGTIGSFPTPSTADLLYVDGYFLTLKQSTVGLYNSEVDDPTTWDSTKFITPQMYNGLGVGIAHQNNLVFVFSETSLQAFYNNANATGSPFSNYESAAKQHGACYVRNTIQSGLTITWVGTSLIGGNTVWAMTDVTGLKEIATTPVKLLLDAEGSSLGSATSILVRVAGKYLYVLNLASADRTLVYDYDLEIWTEFEGTTTGTKWPIVASCEKDHALLAQHGTNGWIYNVSPTVYQDDSTNFTVLARFGRLDLDTMRKKVVKSYELIGDVQSSTTNVSLQYSDDDYVTLSTARTFDLAQSRPLLTRGGSFRRRAHQLSYAGSNPLRLEALEMRYRFGSS